MGAVTNWRGGVDEWGVAPPYGAYRGHYSDYSRGQAGQVGSGKLGGPSQVSLGGGFDDRTFGDEGTEIQRVEEKRFPDPQRFPPE